MVCRSGHGPTVHLLIQAHGHEYYLYMCSPFNVLWLPADGEAFDCRVCYLKRKKKRFSRTQAEEREWERAMRRRTGTVSNAVESDILQHTLPLCNTYLEKDVVGTRAAKQKNAHHFSLKFIIVYEFLRNTSIKYNRVLFIYIFIY